MKLTQANLLSLPGSISVPNYDRSAVHAGILHIGVGNFHRAHQAVYANDLLNKGFNRNWGICGAGVCAPDAAMRERLAAQDWMSTVVERDAAGMSASVTGAMVNFLPLAEGHGPIIAAIAEPQTRIVSLTVTEGGYFIDAATGEFDLDNPDIRYDTFERTIPRTVFGAIVAGLVLRRAQQGGPVTIMSCDNIPGNGDIARAAVMGVANGDDTGLSAWIEDNVTFPNAMVDRITPATTNRERALLMEHFNIEDASPVFCEPFRQWVLEDSFANGRPEYEAVGVILTPNVHDYEAMKIRILNGGHAIIAYPAGLAGVEFVHDAMAVPEIEAFLKKTITQDVLPNVKSIEGQDPEEYLLQTIERFKNPGVGDTVSRLCLDGSNRQPKFIVPAIRDMLKSGRTPTGLALCSALWCRYCAGVADDGTPIPANDPNWAAMNLVAQNALTNPLVWLEQKDIYGDLRSSTDFCAAFEYAHALINTHGALGAVHSYLEE